MNHAEIEEQQIVDRYVRGTLPAEEVARFEEHYLSCPECLDRLDLAESMSRGFKRAAGQDAVRAAFVQQLAMVAWLARLGRSRQAAVLAMALLVAVLLPWGWAARKVFDRDRELAQARSVLEQERAAAAGRTTSELEASRRELARAQEDRAKAVEQLAEAWKPQNVPILGLSVERGVGEVKPPILHLPATPGWVVLSLAIEPPYRPSYRVILRDAAGKEIWSGGGFHQDGDSLNLTLPSTLLAPGDYTLAAEGAGRFAFRVLSAR
jgi:anti-sigma factor RsiW